MSVVVRTRNEMRTLPRVFEALQGQTLKAFELIVVDGGSTDGTYELALQVADRVLSIREFTHAGSMNLACAHASGDLTYFTNGHSFPVRPEMLATAQQILAQGPQIAGVSGRCRPHREPGMANAVERLVGLVGEVTWGKSLELRRKFRSGMLQTQSALIRRDLALRTPFREVERDGGEDVLWAIQMLDDGHEIAYHPHLDVFHSHGGSSRAALRRFLGYHRMIVAAKRMALSLGIRPGASY